MLKDAYPELTSDAVEAILFATAHDLGPMGRDNEYGYGQLDVQAALANVRPRFVSGRFLTNHWFQVTLKGIVNCRYRIETSTNLTDWTPIATNLATTGTIEFIDTGTSAGQERFYRAALLQ